jgi:hypothetical protein
MIEYKHLTEQERELTRLAEAATAADWRSPEEQQGGTAYRLWWRHAEYESEDAARFVIAAKPTTILALLSEIDRLRGALAFYANEQNWGGFGWSRRDGCEEYQTGKAEDDSGARARAALEGTDAH